MSRQQIVLVTGATGTIGAYLALFLKNKGFEIIASGKRKSDNGFFAEHGIKYMSIDIAKAEDFTKLRGMPIGTVLHMGGVMPAAMEGYHPDQYVDSIIRGTLNVLEYMRENGVSKIIFGQSRADSNYLMDKPEPIPSDIEKRFPKTGDHAVYAICKNTAVDLIEHYYYQHKIKRFVLRLPTIYAYHPNPYFYVNGAKRPVAYKLLIKKAMKGDDIEIWGNPKRAKEITSIRDLEQVVELAINSEKDGGMYNVGRGVGVTLEEQILGIIEVFSEGKKSNVIYRPDKPDARQFVHDISKTKRDLGYVPQDDYISLLINYKEEMRKQRFRKLWGLESDYEES